jgi:hypothetical protein
MTIATALGLLNLLAIIALAAWLRRMLERNRRTEAQHRLDVIARLGGVTVAVEQQTEAFHTDGTALLREVRAAAASPVPPPPTSGTRAAEPEQDVQERPTVEMGCYGRDSDELTAVVDTSGGVIRDVTRRKLVSLARTMVKGGVK